jgi:hypothetical protein
MSFPSKLRRDCRQYHRHCVRLEIRPWIVLRYQRRTQSMRWVTKCKIASASILMCDVHTTMCGHESHDRGQDIMCSAETRSINAWPKSGSIVIVHSFVPYVFGYDLCQSWYFIGSHGFIIIIKSQLGLINQVKLVMMIITEKIQKVKTKQELTKVNYNIYWCITQPFLHSCSSSCSKKNLKSILRVAAMLMIISIQLTRYNTIR